MKYAALLVLALFIDGLQAAITASLAVIAAAPGTFGGGVAGCLAGNYLAGGWGCSVLGFLGGFFGTALDVLAVATEPIGLALGFVISICLSFTLGAGLIMLLILSGMFYPKYLLPGGISELIPGFDIFPAWTTMVILCIVEERKRKGGVLGAVVSAATGDVAGAAVAATKGNQTRSMDGVQAPAATN